MLSKCAVFLFLLHLVKSQVVFGITGTQNLIQVSGPSNVGSYTFSTSLSSATSTTPVYVRCVAVSQNQVPTVTQVLNGQTTGDIPAVSFPPANLVTPATAATGGVAIQYTFTGLTAGTVYDSYCAFNDGVASSVLSVKHTFTTQGMWRGEHLCGGVSVCVVG